VSFPLKPITQDAVPRALAKAERYRVINDPVSAESICLDVLLVDPANQQGLVTLLLAITDQFGDAPISGVHRAREVLPRLDDPPRRPGRAVLHPTCTLVKSGGLPDLLRVARTHAEEVVVPPGAECCGFAGDRGFVVPELTRAATTCESAEVRGLEGGAAVGLYSTCRTCEIGMSRAVGRPYGSIVHLVREAMLGG